MRIIFKCNPDAENVYNGLPLLCEGKKQQIFTIFICLHKKQLKDKSKLKNITVGEGGNRGGYKYDSKTFCLFDGI